MADPLQLADVLRAAGLKVIEHDGWKLRGHGDFRDIRGVLCHHTAGGGTNDWTVVQNGRPDLPGPLAQLVLERDGTYRVIAAGVCWHAGRGSWPSWPTNDANWHVIGIEAVNDGRGQPWPAVQLDAYKRGAAAILRKIELNSSACAGHKEYSSEGKIDPFGIDMRIFRSDVQKILDNKTAPTPEVLVVKTDSQRIKDVREQLVGFDKTGKEQFVGWDQLGGKTVVDAVAAIGVVLRRLAADGGVDDTEINGFKAPR